MGLQNFKLLMSQSSGWWNKLNTCTYFLKRAFQKCGLCAPSLGETYCLNLQRLYIHFNKKSLEIRHFEEIFIDKAYERNEDFIPQPGWTIIDLGANIGLFALRNSQRIENGKILCVEPNPMVFPILLKNLRANYVQNVNVFPLAIGEKTGKEVLRFSPSLTTEGSIINGRFTTDADVMEVEVTTETLDDFGKTRNLTGRIDLIKMDIEGAEIGAIRGGNNLLKRTKRVMIDHDSSPLKPLQDEFHHLGFENVLNVPHPFNIAYFINGNIA